MIEHLTLPNLKDFFQTIPGLLLFPYSLYFFWIRTGNKISAYITKSHSRTSAPYLSTVVLRTHREQQVAIHNVIAVIDKDISIVIDSFNPPLILEPLGLLVIKINEVSYYLLGNEKYEPHFNHPHKIDIKVTTNDKVLDCIAGRPPTFITNEKISDYRTALVIRESFNEKVYSENVIFAIVWMDKDTTKTAFIDRFGFVSHYGQLWFNSIDTKHLNNTESLEAYLKNNNIDKYLREMQLVELRKPHE